MMNYFSSAQNSSQKLKDVIKITVLSDHGAMSLFYIEKATWRFYPKFVQYLGQQIDLYFKIITQTSKCIRLEAFKVYIKRTKNYLIRTDASRFL